MAQTKYQRCLVMAGGGFHYGYYLGIFAAMTEFGNAPDIVLASCGGAIAASIVQALPNDAQRKEWLESPQMYNFWCTLKAKEDARLSHIILGAIKRRCSARPVKYLPDLFGDYMFEIPQHMPLPTCKAGEQFVDVAIVAGKLLYAENEVGQLRGSRKLFSEIIFCSQRAADLLEGLESPLSSPRYGDNAIASELLTDVSMPIIDAVRASIADMFYFRCHSHSSGNYMGGVLDLFPIEVASRLADSVTMELKSGYDTLVEQPALQAVLGFDGNLRLQDVLQQHADSWVDTSDMERYFLHQRIQQKIMWHKNKIDIVAPPTYEQYVKLADAQWQYGYRRGVDSFAVERK